MTRKAEFTEQMGRDLYDVVAAHKGATGPPPRGSGESAGAKPHTIVCALLDDIESGDEGLAAVLTRLETNQRQIVDVQGVPPTVGSGIPPTNIPTFRLKYKADGVEEQTGNISADATPDEVRRAIETMSFFNPGDIRVELGKHQRPQIYDDNALDTFIVRRWIIEFTGKFEDEQIELFTAAISANASVAFTVTHTTVLADTGTTELVRCVIPVGVPTPLRAGAIAVASWTDDFGYILHAVEPRSLQTIANPDANNY